MRHISRMQIAHFGKLRLSEGAIILEPVIIYRHRFRHLENGWTARAIH